METVRDVRNQHGNEVRRTSPGRAYVRSSHHRWRCIRSRCSVQTGKGPTRHICFRNRRRKFRRTSQSLIRSHCRNCCNPNMPPAISMHNQYYNRLTTRSRYGKQVARCNTRPTGRRLDRKSRHVGRVLCQHNRHFHGHCIRNPERTSSHTSPMRSSPHQESIQFSLDCFSRKTTNRLLAQAPVIVTPGTEPAIISLKAFIGNECVVMTCSVVKSANNPLFLFQSRQSIQLVFSYSKERRKRSTRLVGSANLSVSLFAGVNVTKTRDRTGRIARRNFVKPGNCGIYTMYPSRSPNLY